MGIGGSSVGGGADGLQMNAVHGDMPPVNLDDLRALLDVARSGSVSKAALALGVTQPAVTRRLQRVEAALGVVRLDRRARPLALTEAGHRVVARLPRLFAALEELRGAGRPARMDGERCRLGLVTSVADRVIDGVVTRLARTFPQVMLRVVVAWTADLLTSFRDVELDGAVGYVPDGFVAPPGAEIRTLGHRRTPEAWVVNASGCCFREKLGDVCRAAGRPLRIGLEVDGVDRQLELVAQGAGIGFVPAPLLRSSPVRSRLRRVRIPGSGASVHLGLVYRRRVDGVPEQIHRYLRRWLRAA